MLTKEEYKSIAGNWKGTIYQNYDRYQVRFPMLLKHIDVFKEKNVLEVGSNAGIAAYHIAKVAKSYIGVEAEKGYFQQALETKKFIYNNNAEFLNMSVKSYMKRAIRDGIDIAANACYLSYVLYHFSDKEVRMFEQNILPKLDVIIVQSRYENRNKKGRTAHNSYKFWEPKNMEKYLNKNGFSTTVEFGPRNKFHFIIGRKAYSDEEVLKQEDQMIHEALIEEKPLTMDDIVKIDKGLRGEEEDTAEEWNQALVDLIDEGKIKNGDKGNSTVHTEGQGKASPGRRTRSGKGRMAEGKPRGAAGGEASPKRPRRVVRSKDGSDGDKDVLQPVVEKSPEEELCDTDIQKVEKAPRNKRRTKTDENSVGEGKPAV